MATVTARVTRRGFNRVKGGILVRHRVGDQVEVTARELELFADRLERVDGPVGPEEPQAAVIKHDLVSMGAALRVGDTGAPSGDDSGGELAGGDEPPADSPVDPAPVGDDTVLVDDAEAAEAQRVREERIARVNAAGDVQSLRLLAYEFGVDVSNRWTAAKTRAEILAKL